MELNTIYQSVQQDLGKVEQRLGEVSHVDDAHLSELLDYSLVSAGKRIRPALTLLSGKFYDYNLETLLPMASATEILHMATLVHDDAIDSSPIRRGRDTVYKIWGVDKAVLLGDYLFAEAGAVTATTQNLRVIQLFAQTIKIISSGEINQAYNAFNLEQDHSQYFQRIASKTAALFCLSTESGSVLSQAPEKSIQALIKYAYNTGIAFQVIDDILDFIGTEDELGKPVGSDLNEGTLTLPAMFLLEQYPDDNPVKKLFNNREELDNIRQTIEMVANSSIIQQCYQVASEYCDLACQDLKLLPDNSARQALYDLANYILSRRK